MLDTICDLLAFTLLTMGTVRPECITNGKILCVFIRFDLFMYACAPLVRLPPFAVECCRVLSSAVVCAAMLL